MTDVQANWPIWLMAIVAIGGLIVKVWEPTLEIFLRTKKHKDDNELKDLVIAELKEQKTKDEQKIASMKENEDKFHKLFGFVSGLQNLVESKDTNLEDFIKQL